MDTRTLIREAGAKETEPARMAELAGHPDEAVRRAVARNGSIADEVLARLLEDESWEVRAVAAHHKRAPREKTMAVLQALATSPEAAKRSIAARSPHATPEMLLKLIEDPDPETRSNAAKHSKTPPAMARARLTDSEPCVVLGALAHPSVTNQERRAFITQEFLMRFFEAHADGEHLFEALCERFLWDVLERAFLDNERFDDTWQELVKAHFELIEIPSRGTVLAAVHRDHWKAVTERLAAEVQGSERKPD